MAYSDAIARINEIQSQVAALGAAFSPARPAAAAQSASPTAAPASATTFAAALAQAQVAGAADPSGAPASPATLYSAPAAASVPGANVLTAGQQQFAARLAADTGLDPHVISAWLLAEESGGAATSRQSAGNNDWLNIGYTDSGTFGAGDSIWSDPLTAADATAGWLRGQSTIPSYGTASAGIQAIVRTAGQPPQAQIAAIQQSGWASSGYPDLPALYQQVAV